MVNEQVVKGNWTELRGRVKEKWGALTDDDLVLAEGKADQLIGIIQRRTGESREKIEHDLEQLTSDYGSAMEKVRRQATAAVGTASESARKYVDRASEGAHEYADRASATARQQYEQLHGQYDEAAAMMQAKYAEAENAVRRKPIESLCVAFGSGLIAGVIVGLSFRPHR